MRYLGFVFSVLILVAGVVSADESVPAFQYDNQHTGRTDRVGPEQPELLWKFRTQASITASPIVDAKGTIYLASTDGSLYALNSEGTVDWQYEAEESIFGTPATAPDGSVLFGDLSGRYYSIRPDGSENWVYRVRGGSDRRIIHAPVVDAEGQSYFGSWNEQLFALQADGSLNWQSEVAGLVSSAPVLDEEGNVYMAVTVRNQFVVSKYHPSSSRARWTFQDWINLQDSRVISSPAIDASKNCLYVGVCTDKGMVYAIDLTRGQEQWSHELPKGVISSPAIGIDGTVYVGCLDGKLYALEPEQGEIQWSFEVEGYFVFGSPSVDGNGVIYVGDSDGVLYAISPEGDELWRYETGNSIESSPVVASDGTLYFTSTDSTLYALKNPTAVWKWVTH